MPVHYLQTSQIDTDFKLHKTNNPVFRCIILKGVNLRKRLSFHTHRLPYAQALNQMISSGAISFRF
jgi:hypothetical protein